MKNPRNFSLSKSLFSLLPFPILPARSIYQTSAVYTHTPARPRCPGVGRVGCPLGSLLSGARAVSPALALAFPLACHPRRHAAPWHVLDCRVAASPLATVRTADLASTAARLSEVPLATPGNHCLVSPTARTRPGHRSVRPTARRVAAGEVSAALLTELAAGLLSSRLGTRPRLLAAPHNLVSLSGASALPAPRPLPCRALSNALAEPFGLCVSRPCTQGSARRLPMCRPTAGRSARPAPPCALVLA